MKRELMEILACPRCKADLELVATEEKEGEVRAGYLTCVACQQSYPISEGIPDLSPPEESGGNDYLVNQNVRSLREAMRRRPVRYEE